MNKSSTPSVESILKTVIDAIISIDETGIIQSVNPAVEKIFGYSPEELMGKNVSMLMPDPYSREHDGYLKKYLRTGQAKIIGIGREVVAKRKDGTLFPAYLGVSEGHKEGGRRFFTGIIHDLTEVNALKKKEALLKAYGTYMNAIIETVKDPFIVLDSTLRIKMANQSFYQTFQVAPGETENKLIYDVGNGQWNVPAFRKLLESILSQKMGFDDHEVEKEFPGIGRRIMTVSGHQIQDDGKEETILLTVRDITYRKQMEEKLKRAVLELEHSNRELAQFAYVASHDLQEPLRKVISFTERLKEQTKTLGDEAKVNCEKIHASGIRMKRVIEDILYFSRIGSQEKAFEETDLNRIAQDVISDLELKILETKTKIEVKELPKIQANKSLIRHVFQNLILNSIKFAKKDVRPDIIIDCYSQDNSVEIRFKDNGIGFDEKYVDRIFKPFQRLHAKQEYDGTGIGLSICHKIVTQHGGTITAKSKPGEGATFIVMLPINAHQGIPGAPPKILSKEVQVLP